MAITAFFQWLTLYSQSAAGSQLNIEEGPMRLLYLAWLDFPVPCTLHERSYFTVVL
jgi:hypothetical protein